MTSKRTEESLAAHVSPALSVRGDNRWVYRIFASVFKVPTSLILL